MKGRNGIIYSKAIFDICEKLVVLKLAKTDYYFIMNQENKRQVANKHKPAIFWMLISLSQITHAYEK